MKKKFNLENKKIIITGGASGIGKAIVIATVHRLNQKLGYLEMKLR